ncbi:hypothetical protein HAX54_015068, partial [Datura stramonium]|nr:hypothetical protein [Datura stramonium]
MATFDDSFLADLEELNDNTTDVVAAHMEEDYDDEDLDNITKLQKSRCYIDIMQKVEDALIFTNKGDVFLEKDDPEYKLIVDCNALSIEIEDEIFIIHNFIRDKYRLKFPELESL